MNISTMSRRALEGRVYDDVSYTYIASVTIIYHLGCTILQQFTTKMFARFTTTG